MAPYTYLIIILLVTVSLTSGQNACTEDLSPHPDCTKYFQCVHGAKVVRDCGPGTHFNPTLKICDFPGNAGCTGGAAPAGPTFPGGSAGPTFPEGPVGAMLPEGPAGSWVPEGSAGSWVPEGPAGPWVPEGPAGPWVPEGPAGSWVPEGPAGPVAEPAPVAEYQQEDMDIDVRMVGGVSGPQAGWYSTSN